MGSYGLTTRHTLRLGRAKWENLYLHELLVCLFGLGRLFVVAQGMPLHRASHKHNGVLESETRKDLAA